MVSIPVPRLASIFTLAPAPAPASPGWLIGDPVMFNGRTGLIDHFGDSPFYGDARQYAYVIGLEAEFADWWPVEALEMGECPECGCFPCQCGEFAPDDEECNNCGRSLSSGRHYIRVAADEYRCCPDEFDRVDLC